MDDKREYTATIGLYQFYVNNFSNVHNKFIALMNLYRTFMCYEQTKLFLRVYCVHYFKHPISKYKFPTSNKRCILKCYVL